jgi:hypothetical protein
MQTKWRAHYDALRRAWVPCDKPTCRATMHALFAREGS